VVARLAGVAVLSGWFPESLRGFKPAWYGDLLPTYWKGKEVGKRRGVQMFLAHGLKDSVVEYELGKTCYKRAKKAGFSMTRLYKFAMGHGLCQNELLEFNCWLDDQLPDPIISVEDVFGADLIDFFGDDEEEDQEGLDHDMLQDLKTRFARKESAATARKSLVLQDKHA